MTKMLIMPLAVPGTGKTTFLPRLFPHAWVVAKDQVRRDLYGDMIPPEYPPGGTERVDTEYLRRVQARLRHRDAVIADANHKAAAERRQLRNLAADCDAEVVLVIFRNVDQAQARYTNPGRHGVPGQVMRTHGPGGWIDLRIAYEQALSDVISESYAAVMSVDRVGRDGECIPRG